MAVWVNPDGTLDRTALNEEIWRVVYNSQGQIRNWVGNTGQWPSQLKAEMESRGCVFQAWSNYPWEGGTEYQTWDDVASAYTQGAVIVGSATLNRHTHWVEIAQNHPKVEGEHISPNEAIGLLSIGVL